MALPSLWAVLGICLHDVEMSSFKLSPILPVLLDGCLDRPMAKIVRYCRVTVLL